MSDSIEGLARNLLGAMAGASRETRQRLVADAGITWARRRLADALDVQLYEHDDIVPTATAEADRSASTSLDETNQEPGQPSSPRQAPPPPPDPPPAPLLSDPALLSRDASSYDPLFNKDDRADGQPT